MITNNYTPIPNNIEQLLYNKSINKNKPFACLTENQIEYFTNHKHFSKYNITIPIIENIKKQYIRDIVIKKHHLIINQKSKIKKMYEKINILEISKIYNFPPILLLQQIFDNDKIKQYINNKNVNLSNYGKENIDLALQTDCFSITDEKTQLEESLQFEKKIEKILKYHNIKFKTQDDLTQEQITKYGKAVNTPDFLLEKPYKNIHWIDAKNFYGANTKFNYKKIAKQTQKYIDSYGSGCIIFNLGFSEELASKFKNIKFYSITQFQ